MTAPAFQHSPSQKIRVMIVDDSAVVRGLTRRWLEGETRIELVKQCADGAQALADAAECRPDVILLDVEMPKMDGLAALPLLKRIVPDARVIMASSLTSEGAATTVRALSLGAADYVAKPNATSLGSADSYRKELVDKIIALGSSLVAKSNPMAAARRVNFSLRQAPAAWNSPQALVIASSTGGPQALQDLLTPIARRIEQPILIVQHMPPAFTRIFAEKLGQTVGKPCREAVDGDVLAPGTMLLAPGDYHMRVAKGGGLNRIVRLDRGAPVNYCRPAADPLFDSASEVFGSRVLAVVLTGMGSDGKNGAGTLVKGGGRVIVQDESTSVVWGMPGAVATAGFAEAVKPLNELSAMTLRLMTGGGA